MAVTKLRISVYSVYVIDDGHCWGPGEWSFAATVDGKTVGDVSERFEARDQSKIVLNDWSVDLDVSKKTEGSSVDVKFEALDGGTSQGKASARFKYPFKQNFDGYIAATAVGGGPFSSSRSRYWLRVIVTVLQEKITSSLPDTPDLFANRQAKGTNTFTTLSGTRLAPRVEICPVVPVPSPTALPPRPKFPVGFAMGKKTPQSQRVDVSSGSALNALPNPAVIPVLDPKDPAIQSKAARIAVTYMEPGNLLTDRFAWSVKSGSVAFLGDTEGQAEVLAYGTSRGAADEEAIIELRWGKGGPLLSTFRALTGKIREVPFRALVLNPSEPADRLRVSPGDVSAHVGVANVYLWQAGLKLAPDPENDVRPPQQFRGYDGVTAEGQRSGIFSLALPKELDDWSIKVDPEASPPAARLNFRPGVLNIVFIKSTTTDLGSAIDRKHLDGAAVTEDQRCSPSSSWVQPSGVPPDGAAGTVTMKTADATNRRPTQSFPTGASRQATVLPNNFDKERKYLKKRLLPDDAFDWLFTLVVPDLYPGSDPSYGATLANVTCQVLGLKGRGYFGKTNGSEDGINHPNGIGYPFWENLMSPGALLPWSQDLDVIQAKFLRKHPLANPLTLTLGHPPFAAGFDASGYPTDNTMKIWSLASPYSFVGYYLGGAPCHKNVGWLTQRPTLIQQGWKILPIYVGNQPLTDTSTCPNRNVTGAQGVIDGREAVDNMAEERFAPGTYVYLDIEVYNAAAEAQAERADPRPVDILEYIRSWVTTVLSYSSTLPANPGVFYNPGIYCHRRNVGDIEPVVSAAMAGMGVSPRFWVVGGYNFSLDDDPTTVSPTATLWQSPWIPVKPPANTAFNKEKHVVAIAIDQNVSSLPDPAGPPFPLAT